MRALLGKQNVFFFQKKSSQNIAIQNVIVYICYNAGVTLGQNFPE